MLQLEFKPLMKSLVDKGYIMVSQNLLATIKSSIFLLDLP